MKKKINYKLLFIIVLIFVGVLVFVPLIMFNRNEKKLLSAAKHYFEINANELPAGEKIRTIYLNELYKKSFIKEDLFIPLTNKLCSLENSWVKVKKENNEYRYYTYLKCGIFSSKVDHTGPAIKLNGKSYMTVGKGEEFTDPGINSVIDKVDGKISIDSVTIKGKVDTSKIGSYTLTYVVTDKLGNRGIANREVDVVEKIGNTIKEKLGDKTNFVGNPTDNYVRLSNMLFRVYGIDSNNDVILVSDENISYISYSSLEKWLDYYYDHLNEKTKQIILSRKYCNEVLENDNFNSTECGSYTKERNVFIPSIDMINRAKSAGENFMQPGYISWVANKKDGDTGYATIGSYQKSSEQSTYLKYKLDYNLNVRPMFTIKKDTLIVNGNGTYDDPYTVGDVVVAKAGSKINKRYTGEYISINGDIYRIVDVLKDGTVKVISDFTIKNVECSASSDSSVIVYNPKKTTSVAYFINNQAIAYIDTDLFVNHKISVPIYENSIVYGEEKEVKEYTVKLSAPNMFEMFSAIKRGMEPYWFSNSSKAERITGVVGNEIPLNSIISRSKNSSIRVVAYLSDEVTISGGKGINSDPYKVN